MSEHRYKDCNWMNWCRLCAKVDNRNIKVYCKEKQIYDVASATIMQTIQLHFQVQLYDGRGGSLCAKCYKFIEQLGEFTELVKKGQTFLEQLHRAASIQTVEPKLEAEEVDIEDEHPYLDAAAEAEPHQQQDTVDLNSSHESVNVENQSTYLGTSNDADKQSIVEAKLGIPYIEGVGSWSGRIKCSRCKDYFKGCEHFVDHIPNHCDTTLTPVIKVMIKSPSPFCNSSTMKMDLFYLCLKCCKRIEDLTALSKHNEHHERLEQCRYVCSVCDQRFPRFRLFRKHMWQSHSLSVASTSWNTQKYPFEISEVIIP